MAGGKETPRQKMIGMMYLVLTALLALNVSKEILDAFITINDGLETTKVTFDGKLSQQYAAFNASYM
ncbi:MAG: gliding motility protein GldM, partial [Cryomorphaceae bacterium]